VLLTEYLYLLFIHTTGMAHFRIMKSMLLVNLTTKYQPWILLSVGGTEKIFR